MSQKSRVDKLNQRLKRHRDDKSAVEKQKKPKFYDASAEAFTNAIGLGESKPSSEIAAEKSKNASKLQVKYEHSLALYMHEGMSQASMLVLRRLISEADIPSPRNKECLMKLLTDASKELLLNELELVAWAIYMEKFVWKDLSLSLETLLLYSAFAVKSYMNDEVAMFQTHLNNRFINFTSQYNQWITKIRSRMGIPARELNTKYRKLTKPLTSMDDIKVIDYNIYVDDILQVSPPYTALHDRAFIEMQRPELQKQQPEVDDHFYTPGILQPILHKQDSVEDNDAIDLTRQWSNMGTMMPPSFERYDSALSFFPSFSRQNSANTSTHQMQLRRMNSKEEVAALPTMNRANSFVSSLINSDYP